MAERESQNRVASTRRSKKEVERGGGRGWRKVEEEDGGKEGESQNKGASTRRSKKEVGRIRVRGWRKGRRESK